MIQLQNEQFTNKTLDERECSAECSQKLFTGKYLCRIKCEPKSLIYPCSLHLHYINDPCTQLFFSGFYRIFKNIFPLEHSWASASDFILDIFKSNKYMNVSFPLTIFYRKKDCKVKNPIDFKTVQS